MSAPSTIDLAQAADMNWDAVVVGAGPAGAVAAQQLAVGNARVLLVDRATFPRFKVCGCCLNRVALGTLRQAGLDQLPAFQRGVPVTRFEAVTPGSRVRLPLPNGLSLSRAAMDPALIEAAKNSGARFLAGTHARLGPLVDTQRIVSLRTGTTSIEVRASVVIAADGLSGRLLADDPHFVVQERPEARIGTACVVPHAPGAYRPGVIYMACIDGGYAGLVRLEDGALNIAAAVAPVQVAAHGGVGGFVERLLEATGLPAIPDLQQQRWHGSGRMTRRRVPLASERVFVVGDAGGYVEPFTGEGMGIALASGFAVAPLARVAMQDWRPELITAWERQCREMFAGRRRLCRLLTLGLRSEWLTRVASQVVRQFPQIAAPYVRYINQVALPVS